MGECSHLLSVLGKPTDRLSLIQSSLFYPDGGERLRQVAAATGEPVLPLMEWKLSTPQANKDRTIHELWDLNADREAYRSEYLRHWKEAGVDIVICPAHTQTAARHGTSQYWGYTSVCECAECV